MHINTGSNFGNIGRLINKESQLNITDEKMVNNFIEEQSKEQNTNPDDERLLQEAAVAVEETLTFLQIPEDQWPLVIQRTRISSQ